MASAVPDASCKSCLCLNNASACHACGLGNYTCPGTCVCCEENRKKLPPASTSVSGEGQYCSHCKCKSDTISCKDCSKRKILCRGTCLCCRKQRNRKRGKSCNGKFSYMSTDEVLPSTESKGRDKRLPIFLIRAKSEPSPETSQPANSNANSPSFSKSVSEEKNVDNGKYCPECECTGDSIPCKPCRLPEYLCRGSCSCCRAGARDEGSSFFDRFKRNTHKEMVCPRCLYKLGEGTCDECLIHSKKSSSSVPPEDKVMHYKTVHQPVPMSRIRKIIPPLELQVTFKHVLTSLSYGCLQ